MKKIIFIAVLIASVTLTNEIKAQLTGIAINDNGAKADTSAILDVNVNTITPKRGFLLPRMTTTQRDAIYQPAKGLMIYVTNVDSLEINLGTPSAPVWGALSTSAAVAGWLTTGNSGTNSSTNFLGTTDNVGLSIRTNNSERMFIDNLGRVGIGSNTFDPDNPGKLLVDYGTTTSNTVANFKGSIDSYLQLNIKNTSTGTSSSSDIVATADNGTDTTFYIDMGINGSNYSSGPDYWGGPNDGYLYTYARNLLIGTGKASTDIIFLLGGGSIKNNAAFRIGAPSGNIIIGKGENSNSPVGNILRGPNASITSNNISGGALTIQGGSASSTGTGGSVNIYGGNTVSGTTGAVNINTSLNSATNINTGTSTSDVTIGGSSNNILFPKFTTVGGLIYTAANTGQIGALTPGTSGYVLQSNGSGSAPTWVNPSSLVISNAWALAGNGGTVAGTNFIGTTDAVDFVTKTNNTERMRILSTGNIGIGTTTPATTFQVNGITSFGRASATNGQINFYNSANANTVNIASGITSTGYTLTLPTAAPTANGQVLTSTTGGVLSWANSASSNAWQLTGNSGTTAGTNFIGTTDAVDFVTKTGNSERMRVTSAGDIVIGAGDNSGSPTGGIIRGTNASGGNRTGSDITIQAGNGTGTGGSGNIIFQTGLSGSANGSAADIMSEKMRIDDAGKVGIGTTTPGSTLDVKGTIRLSGFTSGYVGFQPAAAAGSTTYTLPSTDGTNGQQLTTNGAGVLNWSNAGGSAWNLTGNSGTTAGTNFIGTTDAKDFVTKTNGTERIRVLGATSGSSQAGWIGMGITLPRSSLDVTGNFSNKNVITLQNTSNTGYSSVDMMDNSGNLSATFGFGNPGTGSFFGSRAYMNTYNNDFVFTNSASNYNLFIEGGGSGQVGVNTNTPVAQLDVQGTVKLGASGTVLNGIIKTTGSLSSAVTVPLIGSISGTITVTGATTNASVIVNPRSALPTGVGIAYARVSAANTITINFIGSLSATASVATSIVFDITLIQ